MITTAVILVAVLGGVFGLVLATASKKFAVEEDPRIGEITNLLPGANCGGCGFAGCGALADAIVSGQEKTPPNAWSAAQKTRKPLPL